ncbi:MAG: hypothetical protein K6B39_06185 [Lachnospiraceae bacterium]|nr:hypothetical protein [Lachnospiraceae bacterium]
MRRVLYIDFENVSRAGLNGIARLTKNDLVRIFLGPKCSKMSLIDADMVFHCDATVELITNDQIGKNALDFIIMVHLGYDIAKKAGNAYYVISNDKGYEPAINEMKSMTGCTIERLPDVDAVIARGEVKTGLFSFLHRTIPTPVADNATQHEVLGKNARRTTTRRVVGSGAGAKSADGARTRRTVTGRTGTAARTQTVRMRRPAETGSGAAQTKPETGKIRPATETNAARTTRTVITQEEQEILEKAIAQSRTKQEFHNYLAKHLDNKDHIVLLYNKGKRMVEIDEEAVRRENANPEEP